jgi:hypothetical protein
MSHSAILQAARVPIHCELSVSLRRERFGSDARWIGSHSLTYLASRESISLPTYSRSCGS